MKLRADARVLAGDAALRACTRDTPWQPSDCALHGQFAHRCPHLLINKYILCRIAAAASVFAISYHVFGGALTTMLSWRGGPAAMLNGCQGR